MRDIYGGVEKKKRKVELLNKLYVNKLWMQYVVLECGS